MDNFPIKTTCENAASSMSGSSILVWHSAPRLEAARNLRPHDNLVSIDLAEGLRKPYPAG